MLDLAPDQLHLWQYAVPVAPEHLEFAMTLLSEAEKQRRSRFRFDRHRNVYALSHAIVRLVLSQYENVKPEDWRFSAGEFGKPEIATPLSNGPLWFNLSHTDDFVACVT